MHWFHHLKIQTKLFLTFGTIVALMIFSNLFAIVQFTSVNKEYNRLLTSSVQRFTLLDRAVEDIMQIRLHNVFLFETGVDTGAVPTLIESFQSIMNAYRDRVISDELVAEEAKRLRLDIWQDLYDRFTNTYIPYQKFIYTPNAHSEKRIGMAILKGARIESEIESNIEKLRHDALVVLKKKSDEATSHFDAMMHLFIGTIFCIVTFSVLLSLLITRTVKSAIVHIQQALVEISRGNLAYPIRSDSRDELGMLTHDIGDMIDNIAEMNKAITVMEHLDSMICIANTDYQLVYINEKMAVAFGLDKESCLHRKCYDVVWRRDQPCPYCLLPKLGEKEIGRWSYVRDTFWEERLGKWLGSKAAIIPWLDGSLVQFAAFSDETAHKVQEELRQEKRIAEAASKSKSEFLAVMSHEIRTPMNAVLGITEILLANEALPQETLEGLDKIYTAGDLLLGIINNILDFSKIEAGKLELAPAKYDVASLIYDVTQLNVMRIGSKPLEFELRVDENTPAEVEGDMLRVKQILNNLLSNAFKYTAEGTVKLSVVAERESGAESAVTLVFRVSDTGQGMTEEQISHLGDEYARFNMDANRAAEGTGLGMHITQSLVRIMSGTLAVDSELGVGSTFTLRLPQENASSKVLGPEVAENLRQLRGHGLEHMHRTQITYDPMPYGSVLIVDDVETNLYVSKGLMRPYLLQVDTASSGFEAIDIIKSGKVYDIVFMDHMMPNMDGMETTRILRDLGYTRPIVALTANAVVGQAALFLANGFDRFISKPIDLRQLNVVLNTLIRDKQAPEVIAAARRQAAASAPADTGDHAGRSQLDQELAASFVRDAEKAIAVLEAACAQGPNARGEIVSLYTINAHALKSALANIGEAELSKSAFRLEQAGREQDFAVIAAETPEFLDALRALIAKVTPQDEDEHSEIQDEDPAHLREKLFVLQAMCTAYDIGAAVNVLTELRQKTWSRKTKELLNAVTEHLLHSDLDEAADMAKGYVESMRAE